ncbi:hypothetical protein CJ030_MR3G001092 [Morella rubra]|uniref:Uncharacterized protein n=1 Tax=Morella rubra TaxID=262757 RepID=A0A6A1W2W1_9ROSI|nr:hypothetical protein CJ030_MR3G001092 [Morella rubra]
MINFRTLLIIFVVSAAILSCSRVKATRPLLCEEFASPNQHDQTYSSIYQNAKDSMACWLERLSSGPSDGGSGH